MLLPCSINSPCRMIHTITAECSAAWPTSRTQEMKRRNPILAAMSCCLPKLHIASRIGMSCWLPKLHLASRIGMISCLPTLYTTPHIGMSCCLHKLHLSLKTGWASPYIHYTPHPMRDMLCFTYVTLTSNSRWYEYQCALEASSTKTNCQCYINYTRQPMQDELLFT